MSSSNLRWRAKLLIQQEVRKMIADLLDSAKPGEIVRSCISCEHFVESQEGCKISNMQRPPARVIAFGCPKYENIDDDIPF